MSIPMLRRQHPAQLDPETAEEVRLAMRFLGIPTYRQALPGIHAELRRARRHQHPLSVVAISPWGGAEAGGSTEDEAQATSPGIVRAPHPSFYLLGSLLREVFREKDVMTYAAEQHLFAVVLPETREPGACCAVARLRDLFHQRAGGQVRTGAAEFPRDGPTADDLLAEAKRAWEERPLASVPPSVPLSTVRDA